MLRAHLRDGALAAAKARSHAAAEPRHVAFAIARHFDERPEVAELLTDAKRALEPPGTSYEVPVLTAAAVAILDAIASDDDAIAALRRILAGEGAPAPGETPAFGAGARAADHATAAERSSEASPEELSSPAETAEDVLAELDALVGLDAVKEQVRSVIAVVLANQERARAGHPTVNPGLHLVFTGPPGTGKTTVARLVARLYAACAALPGAKFTEVDRSGLVAGYVGQTALKASGVVRDTLPGVLFVDEAYSLAPTHASDYGAEAIATLVKAMEDHRDELAVIFAGYSEEMSQFLRSNPGLRSRLKTFIDFPDYTPNELVLIFAGFADSTGLAVKEQTLRRAEELFEKAVSRPDFGNGRFARSLFEQAYARMALRASEDGELELNELTELAPEDLVWKEPGVDVKQRAIGFGPVAAARDADNENPPPPDSP